MPQEQINLHGRKTGEAIAANIRGQIASGELAIGDRLPTEDELTEQYGIARTTLREALRILESQGLIRIRRGRGGGATVTMPDLVRLAEPLAVVLQLRQTTTADLDAARLLIEPHLAAWLAENRRSDDLLVLRHGVEQAAAAADADDHDEFGRAAARIHSTILERGGNETLSVVSQLLHRLVVHRYMIGARMSDQALLQRAARSYRRLYELIEQRDGEGAAVHWEKQMKWTSRASKAKALLGDDLVPFDGV
jgi:DNA-binding FadR family transcriptional regulator